MMSIVSCGNHAKEPRIQSVDLIALAKRADTLYKQNNYIDAISCYDSLLFFDTSNGEYYFKRGYSKSMLYFEKAAIEDYKKAALKNYKKGSAYLNIGIIYEGALNIYDSANYYLNQCLKLDPNNLKAREIKNDIVQILKLIKKSNAPIHSSGTRTRQNSLNNEFKRTI